MPLRLTLIALVLGVVTMCGCRQGTAFQSEPQRPHAAAALVAQVSLGRTTASDIERQFGTADERAPDGSLIDPFETVRSRGGRTRTQNETITLRFAGGVLSKQPPYPLLSRRGSTARRFRPLTSKLHVFKVTVSIKP